MFNTLIIAPLYNALISIVNFIPGHYLWVAVVIITVIFKTILLPLYKKQIRDQIILNFLSPKLKDIQDKFKNDREKLARESFSLYKKYKVNPFVSILLLLIPFPLLIGLYQIFYHDLSTYENLLYSGVTRPEFINQFLLGVNLSEKNILFALFAGVTQYFLGALMFKKKSAAQAAAESDMIKALNTQMKYVLPVVVAVISAITPSVIALYLIVTNIYGILQEIVVKKRVEQSIKKQYPELN